MLHFLPSESLYIITVYCYCPRGSDGLYCFRPELFCFSVRKITHEPPHAAGWNFARSRIFTTARTLLILKVIGLLHRSRTQDFRILYLCEIGQKFVSTTTLMNRYTQLDDILHEHVPWQPHEPIEFQSQWSRSFLRATAGTAIARLSHRNSVRPSVCHTGGSGKNGAS